MDDAHSDLSRRATEAIDRLPWQPSPMAGVDRRVLDRVGDEVARATSVVRYVPESRFPAHTHGMGEEFLVLDGTFRDEHGSYPAGTYVRNPWNTTHAPFVERDGCTILVKLRQMEADDQTRVVTDTAELDYAPTDYAGVSRAALHRYGTERVAMERWEPEAGPHYLMDDHGLELVVLEGALRSANDEVLEAPGWLRLPPGDGEVFEAPAGARLWVKRGHLRVRSAPDERDDTKPVAGLVSEPVHPGDGPGDRAIAEAG